MKPTNVADVDAFSRCSAHLTLFYNTQRLAVGSGLLARTSAEKVLLITALHNLTGREPDGRCKSKTAGVPNFVEIKGFHFSERLPLYDGHNEPSQSNPLFWRHAQGPKIDICALPIIKGAHPASTLDDSFLDRMSYGNYVQLSISQICYIIGYPEGLYIQNGGSGVLPIWKTGHIASEPSVYIDSIPKILIDASTCEGMSGSPVLVRENQRSRLVGIYTGRTSQISELGFVFTPETILKIIETGLIHGPIPYD